MKHHRHADPVTLNYACARTMPYPGLVTIVARTLAWATALSLLVAMFVAAFIAPTIHHDHSEAFVSLSHANMNSLGSVFALYHLHVGAYPASLDELMKPPPGDEKTKWLGPYVESADQLKDAWGRRFRYQAPGTHNPQYYDLWSMGKDGEEGTDDDIGNWASDDP